MYLYQEKTETARPNQETSPAQHEEEPKSPFEVPKGCLQIFSWCLTLPALLLFYVTIPDCRKKAWARWYPLTFLLALVWIGGLTYLLVWMVTVIGKSTLRPRNLEHIPSRFENVGRLANRVWRLTQ